MIIQFIMTLNTSGDNQVTPDDVILNEDNTTPILNEDGSTPIEPEP